MNASNEDELELEPARVAELLSAGEVQVIDVREQYERDAGFIEGSRHIELAHLTSEADTIDRTRTVVFSCRVGSRSAMATQAFRGAGYEAYNLRGGLVAWEAAGLPLAPEGGRVANH